MAASTWFHGSAWPPGNHGIMPVGSCQSAMASTVGCSSAAVSDAGDVDEASCGGLAGLGLRA